MKKIEEIKSDYIDNNNLLHIDVYFKDEEEGINPVVIDLDSLKVIWRDYSYSTDKQIKAVIEGVKKEHAISHKYIVAVSSGYVRDAQRWNGETDEEMYEDDNKWVDVEGAIIIGDFTCKDCYLEETKKLIADEYPEHTLIFIKVS